MPADDGSGRYDVAASTKRVLAHLAEEAAGRGDPELRRKHKLEADRLQLRIAREAGQLVSVADVREGGWIVRGTRQFVLAIPGRVAFEIPTLSHHDRQIIERICRDGLTDASLGRGFQVGTSPCGGRRRVGWGWGRVAAGRLNARGTMPISTEHPVNRLRAEVLAHLIVDDVLREQVLALIRAGELEQACALQERHRRRLDS